MSIVCDVMMPEADGYEVFNKLSDDAATVIITIEQCVNAG
jgi:CheY-like chemotaxis protein